MQRKILPAIAAAVTLGAALGWTTAASGAGPVQTGPPSFVTRPYDVGQPLTIDPGTFAGPVDSFSYDWARCGGTTESPGACVDVPGAGHTSTYTILAEDIGMVPRVTIHATDATGTTNAVVYGYAIGTPFLATAPRADIAPDAVGQTVHLTDGTWDAPATHPVTVTFQWRRCDAGGGSCADIPGATANAYTPVSSDVGHTLAFRATATNDIGATSVSAHVGSLIGSGGRPVQGEPGPSASGHPVEIGDVVTADPGAWTSPDGTALSYSYAWQLCTAFTTGCSDAPSGASGATYSVQGPDFGKRLAYTLTVTDGSGSTQVFVPLYWTIGAPWIDPVGAPVVTGTGVVGSTLSLTPATWLTPAGHPATLTYGWHRCSDATFVPTTVCTDIVGATSPTYVVTADDVGYAVYGDVRADNDVGASGWFTDAGVLAVAAAPAPAPSAAAESSSTPASTESSPAVTAATAPAVPPAPSSSAAATAAPGADGRLTLTASGGSASATLAWAAGAFGPAPVQVRATLQPTARSGGVTFAAGTTVLEVDAQTSGGAAVLDLGGVLDLSFAAAPPEVAPVYERGSGPWVAIPALTGTTLPAGRADGWYRSADGTLHVLTRHLTRFGLARELRVPWGVRRRLALHRTRALTVFAGPTVDAQATYVLRRGARAVARWRRALPAGGPRQRLPLPRRLVPGTYRLTVVVTAGPQRWSAVAAIAVRR